MKNKIFLFLILLSQFAFAETKISQLPLLTHSSVGATDSFPFVNVALSETARLQIADLINIPLLQLVGDTGSGGTIGFCPAPPSGGAAAGKFLKADATWAVPPTLVGDSGSGGTKGYCPAPPSGSAAANKFLKADATWAVPAGSVAPTIQRFTSGSGTYTTPTSPGPLYLKIRMIGGGGGGAGGGVSGGTAGGPGGNTTFGSSLLTANGGDGGIFNNNTTAAGGTASVTTSGTVLKLQELTGARGGENKYSSGSAIYTSGGSGGVSPFGGAGASGVNEAGTAAVPNTGSGGGGGGTTNTANLYSGGGGAAGGYVEAIITSPSSSYGYVIGAAGTAGTAGTSAFAGALGGSGIIIVEEHYQ